MSHARYEVDGDVAKIVIDNPPLNLWGPRLIAACDLLWAADGVQFGLVEAVAGITPLMGGTQRTAERAGAARAREFVMTGRSSARRPTTAREGPTSELAS